MGTSKAYRQLRLARQDHPHAYGDKLSGGIATLILLGSSPRVWGQGIYNGLMKPYERIIPTRMGTRAEHLDKSIHLKDHPHAYGDKRGVRGRECHSQGSSPRVWGQVAGGVVAAQREGIIPTRMGTSWRGLTFQNFP